jgi:exonuclease I
MESEAQRFSFRINDSINSLKNGHIKIWGQWLGRPYDNIYKIKSSTYKNDTLILLFEEDQQFIFENPIGCTLYTGFISVRDANNIKIVNKSYFNHYKRFLGIIFEKTNTGIFYYRLLKQKSNLAFEILSHNSF